MAARGLVCDAGARAARGADAVEPLDKDIYALGPEDLANIPSLPASLEEALECLEEDQTESS